MAIKPPSAILTGCVILIRPVCAVFWAGREDTPKSTAIEAFPKSGQVHMGPHAALFEGLLEILAIDLVVIQEPNEDGKVIVSI